MRNKLNRGMGMGPGGNCLCLKCGYRILHQPGQHCREIMCPKCGTALVRESSDCHRYLRASK